MQACHNCGKDNLDGVIFCEKCGVAISDVSISTTNLGDTSSLEAGGDQLADEHIIFLHVMGYEDPITVQILDQAVLGRMTGEADGVVHINLSDFEADKMGVSRRHALFVRDEDRLMVSDLGSTNHTFVNNQQLHEHDQFVIRDGDELKLGRLVMRVFFK